MERILIIGNGFDLDLGLKTSYKDFLESKMFLQLNSNSLLAKYLGCKNQIQNWVDVEHELKNYANGLAEPSPDFWRDLAALGLEQEDLEPYKDAFKSNFIELKEALKEHLKAELNKLNQVPEHNKKNAFRLLYFGTLFNEEGNCHNFNLTKSFNAIYSLNFTSPLDKLNYSSHKKAAKLYFMHGSLKENNIVFGVEDGSVPDEFNFLLKSDHAAFGKAPDLLLQISNEAREFHFFGCSLGDTDNAHFLEFFSALSKTRDPVNGRASQHKLFFYVYGKDGYEQIKNRLLRLTNGQLARFKLNHDVIFYDIKDNKMVDQDFLNQL